MSELSGLESYDLVGHYINDCPSDGQALCKDQTLRVNNGGGSLSRDHEVLRPKVKHAILCIKGPRHSFSLFSGKSLTTVLYQKQKAIIICSQKTCLGLQKELLMATV